MKMAAFSPIAALLALAACVPPEPPIPPTDGPCGPGAWEIEQTPEGPLCHPKGWK